MPAHSGGTTFADASGITVPSLDGKVEAVMTFDDARLRSPGSIPETRENVQDVIPPTERNQDPATTDATRQLTDESARPLTEDERKAAEHDAPVGERVYAPASERVPVDPLEGHRAMVEHTDAHTPEREAAGLSTPPASPSAEPSFARVERPTYGSESSGAYAPPLADPSFGQSYDQSQSADTNWPDDRRRKLFMGIGVSWFTVIASGVGIWLFLRWRSERNKPINRIRRQAWQAASEIRERVPNPDEAARPVMGLTTALLSVLALLWQQSQARSRDTTKRVRRRAESVSDVDWQKRLSKLKERWNPSRLEREKFSIIRH
jgi:hypothetical protein